MQTKNLSFLVFSFLVLLNLGCNNQSEIETGKFDLELIDSTNHSSRVVSVEIFESDGKHFAYAAGEKNTLEAYEIKKDGKLEFIEQYKISNNFGGTRALTGIKINETNLLVLGNKADNALEIHKIKNDGKLEKTNAVFDTDSTFLDEIVTIQHLKIKDRNFIYAGGLDKGLSCFELFENGNLEHIQSINDSDALFLHGIIGMTSLKIEDNLFLITGAFFDRGISCFQVSENGFLKNIDNVKDDEKLFLNGTFPVNSVQLGNENFLLVGHRHNIHYGTENAEQDYHGDGINVFKINAQGQINLHSQLEDNEHLFLKGTTRIEILKLSEKKALVFVGTRDDRGIQVCTLEADGILKPIQKVNFKYSIYNGMTVRKIDNQYYLLVGAYDKKAIEIYEINVKR